MSLIDMISHLSRAGAHAPWPGVAVDEVAWTGIARDLAAGRWTLVSLWAEQGAVHMALFDEKTGEGAVVTYECRHERYPSVGAVHPPAIRFERAIRDLYGLEPQGLWDLRPWLDFGAWDVMQPLGPRPEEAPWTAPFVFLPVEGENLHQIPVGPVHAGIIEPGHFRFTANGETVVRLEQRLGYVHKGIEGLMVGATLEHGAKLAGRTSGDSTVAYALAFARAVEAALRVDAPPRAVHLRALMAELERIANHFGDFGAICNDASFSIMHAQCGILRELTLRTAQACFGHRLMMDRIVPGGVAVDLAPGGVTRLRALIDEVRRRFPELIEVYDNTASLQDRTVTTGILKPELARQFGAGGFVGRASGRAMDARRTPGYLPYDTLQFDVPVFQEGDVNARVWVRIREIEQSLRMIEQILARLPEGPISVEAANAGESREGHALVESFRGDVFVWLRIGADGKIVRGHLRDPSWFQWPLLEVAIEGNIVADFPLCNKSFNCSYSGHDL
ncbi:MAG TPA: NADH-quinone oxidoreductase subunit C [Xanthobacteraceae bacterium]|jgi:Ni,Fe-hydrogenase III large subunit|nr:NADH-quinone oxidoreductase subunit C [Xanthobacteraceae bacterium]